MKLMLVVSGLAAVSSATWWNPFHPWGNPEHHPTRYPGYPTPTPTPSGYLVEKRGAGYELSPTPTPTPSGSPGGGPYGENQPEQWGPAHEQCARLCAQEPLNAERCGPAYTPTQRDGCFTCCRSAGGANPKRHMGRAAEDY